MLKTNSNSSEGFSHHFLLPIIVILIVALIGSTTMLRIRAETSGSTVQYSEQSATLGIATWNVLKYDNKSANLKSGIDAIFAAGATVIGLQEVDDPSFSASTVKRFISSTLGAYSPKGGNPIVWNATAVKKVSGGSFQPSSSKSKRFVYVRFKSIVSGQDFYVINVHMQPGVAASTQRCNNKSCKIYKAQMKSLVYKIKKLQSANIPIFVVGDFNIDYQTDNACLITWHPCASLRAVGFSNSYNTLNFIPTREVAKKYIDEVFYWNPASPRALPSSAQILGQGITCVKSKVRDMDGDRVIHCWNGSDHRPVIVTAVLER